METTRPTLPGVRMLEDFLAKHGLTRAEFARRASRYGTHIDRVTVVNILEGHTTRVATAVSVAFRKATNGKIPVDAWVPVSAELATGTDAS
jgi:plasmid maintenance system antidote protein VapI